MEINKIREFTYERYRSNNFFPSLDGLRAIAVVLVLIVHYGGEGSQFLTGWLGVQMFFVLSGFLITTLLLRESDKYGGISLKHFYLRRVFRIVPVYYLVLAFTVWQTWRLGGESWDQLKVALPYYLTFMNEQTGAAPWKPTWTLGIEWKFYLVWPLLAFFVARGTLGRMLVAAIAAAFLCKFWATPHINAYHYSVLLMGSVLAIVMHDRRGFAVVSQLGRPWISVAVFIGFLFFQTRVGDFKKALGDASLANLYGLAVVILLPAVLGPNLPGRILASKPMVFIGERSYSMYLTQVVVSQMVTGFAPWREHGWAYVAQIVVLSMVVSDAMLRYVEKPAKRVGEHIGKNLRRESVHRPGAVSAVATTQDF
ncbi:acyltransferase family protein [Caballeronia novacaledonica]|uniref:Acyltransferase family protein n=1 Tax=Caballeronia novacaledonica TaxID=1544861 RepID=A0ACB5QZH7_9BURK|nr:acyltransferase family protein [Caballeronia novacaledonica]